MKKPMENKDFFLHIFWNFVFEGSTKLEKTAKFSCNYFKISLSTTIADSFQIITLEILKQNLLENGKAKFLKKTKNFKTQSSQSFVKALRCEIEKDWNGTFKIIPECHKEYLGFICLPN